jgi:hypothetical protein
MLGLCQENKIGCEHLASSLTQQNKPVRQAIMKKEITNKNGQTSSMYYYSLISIDRCVIELLDEVKVFTGDD